MLDPREVFYKDDGEKVIMYQELVIFGSEKITEVKGYKIIEKKGCGSFSTVYKARHIRTGITVAIKIMRPCNDGDGKKYWERVKFETEFLLKFNHPHIIKCFETFDFRNLRFIVLEYLEGQELYDFIVQHSEVSEKASRIIFQQLVSGVNYCHKNGAIHRDLKPENIMITKDGELIKIIDFGLGKSIDYAGELLQSSVGSPNYAAPELILGRDYNSKVDVWACGCVLYALIAGCMPFTARTYTELFKKIKKANYIVKEHFSNDLKNLLSRMLEVNPAERWSIESVRSHSWVMLDDTPEHAPEYLKKRYAFNCSDNMEKIDEESFAKALRIHKNVTRKEGKKILFKQDREEDFFVTYCIIKVSNFNTKMTNKKRRFEKELKKKEYEENIGICSFIEKLPTTLQYQFPTIEESQETKEKSLIDGFSSRSSADWQKGIVFKEINFTPDEVFEKIYDSLEQSGIVWSTVMKGTLDENKTKEYHLMFRAISNDPDGEKNCVSKKDIVAYGNLHLEVLVEKGKKIGYRIPIQFVGGNYLFFTSLMAKLSFKLRRNLNLLQRPRRIIRKSSFRRKVKKRRKRFPPVGRGIRRRKK